MSSYLPVSTQKQVFIVGSKELLVFSTLSSTAVGSPTCATIASGLQTVKTYASESLI